MLNLDEIWVAEYSPQQGCFHIETANRAVGSNLRQIMAGWTNSYLVFAVCASTEEANRACDMLAKTMLENGGKQDEFGRIQMPRTPATAGVDQGQGQSDVRREGDSLPLNYAIHSP
jgi:hypothetical protein